MGQKGIGGRHALALNYELEIGSRTRSDEEGEESADPCKSFKLAEDVRRDQHNEETEPDSIHVRLRRRSPRESSRSPE